MYSLWSSPDKPHQLPWLLPEPKLILPSGLLQMMYTQVVSSQEQVGAASYYKGVPSSWKRERIPFKIHTDMQLSRASSRMSILNKSEAKKSEALLFYQPGHLYHLWKKKSKEQKIWNSELKQVKLHGMEDTW